MFMVPFEESHGALINMLAFQAIICPYIESCLEKHIMTWMFVPLKLIDVQLSWDS